MTKQELVNQFFENARKSGVTITKEDAYKLVDCFLDAVLSLLKEGGILKLRGFGTFQVKQRSARRVINPKTKQVITIPPSKTVKFRPSANLVDAVK